MSGINPTISAILRSIDNSSTIKLGYARQKNLGRAAEELIQQEADRAKAYIRQVGINFDDAIPCEPQTARSHHHVGKFIKVSGFQRELSEPGHFSKDDEENLSTLDLLGRSAEDAASGRASGIYASFEIGGETNDTIKCETVYDSQLIHSLQKWSTEYAAMEFLLFVQLNTQRQDDGSTQSTFEFHLVDARPKRTALQFVSATPGEISYCREYMARKPDLLGYALDLLTKFLCIVGLDKLPIIRESILFMIICAVTEGERGHALVIGPPAVGKSLIHKAGELLQCVFKFAPPVKITEAGLIGSASSNKSIRRPGLVPMANQGLAQWH